VKWASIKARLRAEECRARPIRVNPLLPISLLARQEYAGPQAADAPPLRIA